MPHFYVGSTTIVKVKNGYHGSIVSQQYKKIWKEELKINRHLFHSIIIQELHDVDRDHVFQLEKEWQKIFDAVKCPLFLNKSYAGKNGFCGTSENSRKVMERLATRNGKPTTRQKKEYLLNLPIGSERPTKYNEYGKSLGNFTLPYRESYDEIFDAAIRKKFPVWWIETAKSVKDRLLNLPLGTPRPKDSDKTDTIGRRLSYYVSKTHELYDPEFDKSIKSKFPEWWEDKTLPTKEYFLSMPEGSPRPPKRGENRSLGHKLGSYTNENHWSYDKEFDAVIRKKHPQWWRTSADHNKQEFLSLPVGSSRPTGKLKIAMRRYTTPTNKAFDADFTKQLFDRHPLWFVQR